jgi:hypothetical protein
VHREILWTMSYGRKRPIGMVSKRLGLLIETTGYRDLQLPAAPDGATAQLHALAEVLQSPEIGGFSLSVLIDPTVEAARSAIINLVAGREPDDLVLVYVFGHCIRQTDGRLFLALRETNRSDLEGTALTAAFVQQQLQETVAKKQIIILDGRLGSIASTEALADRDSPLDLGSNFYLPDRDQAILAVSDFLSFCLVGEHYIAIRSAQSLLAESIVRGLRNGVAGEKGDRQVTVNGLLSYLNKGVEPSRRDELPAGWVSERAGDLVFAVYPEKVIDPVKEYPTEPEMPASTSPLDENVKFTTYRPGIMRPEQWRRMIVFMHLDDEMEPLGSQEPSTSEEVEARARQILGAEYDDYRDVVGESRFPIVRESEITLVPEVPGIQFNPPRRSFSWTTGVRLHEESFFMRAPFALAGKLARGRLSIFFGQLLLAEIALNLRVAEEPASTPICKEEENWTKGVAKPFRKIFASYSHQDAAVVEAMERHIRAIGYEYLRDVVNLRSGQHWNERLMAMITDADIFQLFWSRNSAQSIHVEKEWRYAIALQREAFVRPAYWEIPMPEAPEPLRRLHFYLLPGVHPMNDRRKGEEEAAAVGAKRASLDATTPVVPPPAKSSTPAAAKKAEAPSQPPLPDETRFDQSNPLDLPPTAKSVVPSRGDRTLATLSSASKSAAPKTSNKRILGWTAIFGTLIGGCFVVFLSVNFIGRSLLRHPGAAAPASTAIPRATPPIPDAVPKATAEAPISTTPIPTPIQPLATPTPAPTQPLVTPTPAPTQPLVTPTPAPTQPLVTPTPAPTQPLATPAPTSNQSLATPTPVPTEPLVTPTAVPSATPSVEPSVSPSPVPTETPSMDDTDSEGPASRSRHHRHHHRHHSAKGSRG